MKLCDCLEYFRESCEELLRLGTEENALLRAEITPEDSFLAQKRLGLERLNCALEHLRSLPGKPLPEEKGRAREIRGEVQQMLMRLMLLDRQNEQLLLRTSFRVRPRNIVPVPPANRVGKVYRANAAS